MTTMRHILELLSERERRQVYLLLPLIIGMGLLEVAGIASVMPFLALLADPDQIHNNRLLQWLYQRFSFADPSHLLFFVGILVLAILTFGNAYSAFTTWLLVRFSTMRGHSISERLFKNYLSQPYVFFLDQHSSELANTVLSEVKQFVNGVLVPVMQMLAKLVSAIFILALLILVDPVLAVSVAVLLGGAYAGIFVLMRRKLARIGQDRLAANAGRFRAVSEAMGGIKDLKLLNKDQVFLERFHTPSLTYADRNATGQVVALLPRYALETIAFGGILLIILYLLATQGNLGSVLPLIGLYAFASYRLLPALQHIFAAMTGVRYNLAVLEKLHHDLHLKKGRDVRGDCSSPLPFAQSLVLEGIHFHYPNASELTIAGINLSIQPHTSVAFVGATGSGKTTLVDIILGLLQPDSGKLIVDGAEVNPANLLCWQKNLGYVPQHIYLSDDTIASNIAFGVREEEIDLKAVENAARIADIHDFIVNDLPRGYDTVVGERGVRLSGGQRQRIGIARALYHDPSILILDEATSALDGATEETVFQAISEVAKTKTVIMIAHRMTTVRNCDIIYVLDKGKVVAAGGFHELLDSSERFRAIAQTALEGFEGSPTKVTAK